MSDRQHVENGAVETLAERDARLHAWLAGVSPGDTVTVRLNSTDTLTGKVYEAPDAGGTSLCVNATVLRYGNGYPGASFEPDERAEYVALTPEQRSAITRHRPTWQRRCDECQLTVPAVGCPTWTGLSSLLGEQSTSPARTEADRG